MEHIILDHKTFLNLKQEYNKAVKEKKDIFICQGHEFLTAYAKYVIEYLTIKMN